LVVIAGLDPAINPLGRKMDARVKPTAVRLNFGIG
jgi:hypothetical protein